MKSSFAALCALSLLAACGGNPLDLGEVPEPSDPTGPIGEEAPIIGVEVPGVIAQNLRSASYTPGAPSMRIDLRTLDGTPLQATYTKDESLSINGFDAYTVQETRSQRKFLALFRQAGDGAQAGVVADGGQFANYFGGGTFTQLKPFSAPTGNKLLATYVGAYVGLLNTGDIAPGSEEYLRARQSFRVTGDVAMNADFNAGNMSVNGEIANRQVVETGTKFHPVYFQVTDVNGQGAFSGLLVDATGGTVGNYAGAFAGRGAAHVAGATVLTPSELEAGHRPLPDVYPGAVEHGAFVAPVCAPGDAKPCP